MSCPALRYARILLPVLALPLFAGSPVDGIKNFYQVDQHVYRGAQPTNQGLAYLAKIGVKTVVDLREIGERSRAEEKAVSAAGMKYVSVPMGGLRAPTTAEINKILGILEDGAGGAVFIHCKRGADRTGAVIAAYRIDHDGWDNARAMSEAKALGMSFFQLPREAFIRAFQPRSIEASAPLTKGTATAGAAAQTAAP